MKKLIVILFVMLITRQVAHSENNVDSLLLLQRELSPILNRTFLGPNPVVIQQEGISHSPGMLSYTVRGEGKSLRVWKDDDGLILKIPIDGSILGADGRVDEVFMITQLSQVLDEKLAFSRMELIGNAENGVEPKLMLESQGAVSVGSFLVYRSYRARGEWIKWNNIGALLTTTGDLIIIFDKRKSSRLEAGKQPVDTENTGNEMLPALLQKAIRVTQY